MKLKKNRGQGQGGCRASEKKKERKNENVSKEGIEENGPYLYDTSNITPELREETFKFKLQSSIEQNKTETNYFASSFLLNKPLHSVSLL
jgi:hypothetical protein